MEKNDFIKNKNAQDDKKFKKRRIWNGIGTAAIVVGGIAICAAIPLLLPVIGGALATSGILALAGIGAVLEGMGTAMATFGIVKACLIGGAIGAAVGGGVSFIKHKCVDYSIIKDENKVLKENRKLAESLEKVANKSEKVVNKSEKVTNKENQVKAFSPQELDKDVTKGEKPLAR